MFVLLCPLNVLMFFSVSFSVIYPAETQGSMVAGHPSFSLIVAVAASAVVTGVVLTCACLTLSKRLFQLWRNSIPSTFHRL